MLNKKTRALRHLISTVALAPLLISLDLASAQTVDIGAVDVNAAGKPSSETAVGNAATPGSAPALAPSQGSLLATEPSSIVSDKIIQDVIKPGADYNDTVKFTPGFYYSNANGAGDAKGGWRGFADGQYNITYDGIPFGDANNPSHHSAAYFPSAFLGQVTIDRAPGPASQVGYATFGGTLGLWSYALTDKSSGNFQTAYGNFGTTTTSATVQSGLLPNGGKFLAQFTHTGSNGALVNGNTQGTFGLFKYEQPLESATVTLFSSYGKEHYNQVNSITYWQWQTSGKSYGALSSNPAFNTYVNYNTTVKQTDMEYVDLKGDVFGFHYDNDAYTYAYQYPSFQNNAANLAVDGPATLSSIKVPQANGNSIKVNILGVGPNDVSGYKQLNNYRAYGDIFKLTHNVDAGVASGTLRTGVWAERVDNFRYQQYFDFTTGKTYTQLGNPNNVSFKLLLNSAITTVQPFFEYEWRPIDNLTVTPGYKFEAFTRDHNAVVNQTTLAPLYYSHTYTGNLPYFTVRYRFNPETTVYAQVSQGMLAPLVAAYYVFNPNENTIKPELTTNYQIGAVYKTDRLAADLDFYMIKASHFSSQFTDTTGATFYKDGGGATYKGIEAEATYALFTGLALYGSGSLSSGRYEDGPNAGLNIGGTPSFTAAGGLIYDDSRIFGSVLTKVIGDHWGTSGSDQVYGNTVNKIPTYESTDAVLGFRTDYVKQYGLGERLEIKAGVNNIFDSRVVTDIAGTPTSNNPATAGLTYQFQAARTFYIAMKLDF